MTLLKVTGRGKKRIKTMFLEQTVILVAHSMTGTGLDYPGKIIKLSNKKKLDLS